jgi:hypothetical protein
MSATITSDILELVNHNLARSNKQIMAWLALRWDTNSDAVKSRLSQLVKQRRLRRVTEDWYAPVSDVKVCDIAAQLASIGPHTARDYERVVSALVYGESIGTVVDVLVSMRE